MADNSQLFAGLMVRQYMFSA